MDIIGNYSRLQCRHHPMNLLFCSIGVLIGTLIRFCVERATSALSLLLPVTSHVPPVSAIILLAGIAKGPCTGLHHPPSCEHPGEAASV
jgi:TctA family transporter